jgi:hypothetical protein
MFQKWKDRRIWRQRKRFGKNVEEAISEFYHSSMGGVFR